MNLQELGSLTPAGTILSADAADVPISQLVFVAFDTETTGLNPVTARLVELCGVKFRANGAELSTFRSLINPQVHIPEESSEIHGITDDMVKEAPTYEQVVPDFMDWATDAEKWNAPSTGCHDETVFLAHNASFDVSFLETALCRLQRQLPPNVVLDTLALSRQVIDDSQNYQLRTLVEHLGLEQGGYHRALADSHHVKNLFLALLKRLPYERTLNDLSFISGKLYFEDRSQDEASSRWQDSKELATIRDALDRGLNLRLLYAAVTGTERVVTPRSVLFAQGKPYLTAFCHNVSAERTFRIDKIIKIETLGSD